MHGGTDATPGNRDRRFPQARGIYQSVRYPPKKSSASDRLRWEGSRSFPALLAFTGGFPLQGAGPYLTDYSRGVP